MNSFLSFHSSIFHSKIHKHCGNCFERGGGGNSLKETYVDMVHVKEIETINGRGRGRGSKIGSFGQTYFLNDPNYRNGQGQKDI